MREEYGPLSLIGAVLGVIAASLLILVQTAFFMNIASPLIKEHCLKERPSGALTVHSRWTLRVPFYAAIDGEGCVRNSPLREGVAALGIWRLGTPEEQVEESITSRPGARGETGYLRRLLALRLEHDADGERLGAALARARTPVQASRIVERMIASSRRALAAIRGLDPPGELARPHELGIRSTEEAIEDLDDLRSALRRRDPEAAQAAQLALLETLERAERQFERIVGR